MQTISIGSVCIHVHFCLEQNRRSFCRRMAQLQDGLAVIKIVPGEELIQSDKILPQGAHFEIVKFLEKR